MTEPLFATSVPVFEVDGVVQGDLARDLLRLEIEETTAGLKTLMARFVGHGPRTSSAQEVQLYLDGGILDFGKQLNVSLGPEGSQRLVFDGFLSGIEASFQGDAPPEVAVFAEDRLMRLRMTRRMKTYQDVTDADIVQAIASEHGLTAQTDAKGPSYKEIQQWNMSDLAFLRERARLLQAEIWFEENKLYFMTRNKRPATRLTLVRGNELIELEARADLAHQRTKVIFTGYDAQERAGIVEEAGIEAVQTEISGGRTGVNILQQAFGERVSYRVRETPLADAEARAWVRAEMQRRARAFVTVNGLTRGSPDMIVGSQLTLQGVGRPFEGPGYYATRVYHSYDLVCGHQTRFNAERSMIQENA